ncbi:MAG: hypothetical protein O3B75_07695 [Planctomycetota bacterium]|nr:hypothetical protein [Planctomycetota bacterium]
MTGLVNAIRCAVMRSKKTRYRIAKESGVSAPQLCRLVHGQGDLAVSTVEKLAKSLNLRITIKPMAKAKKGR